MADLPKKIVERCGKTYLLDKLNVMEGFSLLEHIDVTSIPDLAVSLKKTDNAARCLAFISVRTDDGREIRLETGDLINNHIDNVFDAYALCYELVMYNIGFFKAGGGQSLGDCLLQSIERLLIPTATRLLEQLSVAVSQVSQNSGESASKKQ